LYELLPTSMWTFFVSCDVGSVGVRQNPKHEVKFVSDVLMAHENRFSQLSRPCISFSQESDSNSINTEPKLSLPPFGSWGGERIGYQSFIFEFGYMRPARNSFCGQKKNVRWRQKNWTISHNWIAGRFQWEGKKAKSINACRKMFYARLDIHSSVVVVQLCICVSSYSVNRLLNLLALPSLLVVVRLMALCKERYTWNRKTTTTTREKTKNEKKTLKSLLLDFSSESEIMYIFMHKMHWCNEFFFSFSANSRSSLYTQTSTGFRVLSFVCTIEWLYHMRTLDGKCKKKLKDSKKKSALAMSVSSLCRECVRRLHKFVQLAITAHSRILLVSRSRREEIKERKSCTV
jgi:hypothetical protein